MNPQDNCEIWQQILRAVTEDDLQKAKYYVRTYELEHSCSTGTLRGNPPLHQAVLTASDDMVLLLIESGFDIHARNCYQETPLHLASRKGRQVIVCKLLEAGADIDCRDCGYNTPLFNAVIYSHPHIASILIKAGCDLDTLNEELMTPLDQAILYDQRDIITTLLKAGCDVKKPIGHVYYEDHYVNSILHSLWKNGDSSNIKLLQNCGYEIKYSDIKGLIQWKHNVMEGVEISKIDEDIINEILTQPLSLMNCCRISIRKNLSKFYRKCTIEKLISQLFLPEYLKDFIALKL